jgi:hypothetical protein
MENNQNLNLIPLHQRLPHRITAKAVGYPRNGIHRLGDDDVGSLATGDGTEFLFEAKGKGGIDGGGIDGLFGQHPQLDAGQREHKRHVARWGASWVVDRWRGRWAGQHPSSALQGHKEC